MRQAAGEATVAEARVAVRVRYPECDPMNVAHHAVYPIWFEIARTELLRQQGRSYRELEAAGVYFVVAKMSVRYRRPARYDDELEVIARSVTPTGIKIEHDYEVRRDGELLATGQTTLACIDGEGKLQPIPAGLFT